jgi:hypothetical protein
MATAAICDDNMASTSPLTSIPTAHVIVYEEGMPSPIPFDSGRYFPEDDFSPAPVGAADGNNTNQGNGNQSAESNDPPCRCPTSYSFPHRRSKCALWYVGAGVAGAAVAGLAIGAAVAISSSGSSSSSSSTDDSLVEELAALKLLQEQQRQEQAQHLGRLSQLEQEKETADQELRDQQHRLDRQAEILDKQKRQLQSQEQLQLQQRQQQLQLQQRQEQLQYQQRQQQLQSQLQQRQQPEVHIHYSKPPAIINTYSSPPPQQQQHRYGTTKNGTVCKICISEGGRCRYHKFG